MISTTNIHFLQSILTFWNHLSVKEQEYLTEYSQEITFKQGEMVYNSEHDCTGILIMKHGELRTYISSSEGREITLYRLNDNEVCVLSASCILKNITFDVQIDSVKESTVLMIPANVYSKLAEDNVYVENFILKSTVDKFSDVMWTMEQILFMSFDRRLAVFLLDEAARSKTDVITLTHEEIAKYMGSAREVVSRMLRYFSKEGLVKSSRGQIELLDKAGLRKIGL